jgi:hypothetical protein
VSRVREMRKAAGMVIPTASEAFST